MPLEQLDDIIKNAEEDGAHNMTAEDYVEAAEDAVEGGCVNHIVMFSGGAASWMTAKRVAEKYGTDNLYLVFADTKMEDEDLYRFLDQAAENVGGKLIRLEEGRNPWDVFKDVRFLGNTRVDPCSRILKRSLIRNWLESNFRADDTVVYLGLDWTEGHRLDRARPFWEPWTVESPLMEKPLLMKEEMLEILKEEGIEPPRLYDMGFSHNNCGGFCIKAGQGHFKKLLEEMPERYRWHEEREEEMRKYLGKDVAIMRDRRNGGSRPLTMRELRGRVEHGHEVDEMEIGGCGCFSGSEEVDQ